MNELQVFSNPEFGAVRALAIDGEPWAVGRDVAGALGYAKPQNAIAAHVDAEDKALAPFQGKCSTGTQQTIIINESGLYSLILSSKLPGAKRFKRWITAEVLPALRRTGRYEMPQAQPQELPSGDITPGDYITAARIVASCQKGRLSSVLTLLERSGLDMSGVMEGLHGARPSGADAQEITEFISRPVPHDWQQWSIDRRRQFWAGEIPTDPKDLTPRDRISAIEVWCELYGKTPRDLTAAKARTINAALRAIPGWTAKTIRAGACYGTVKGFCNDNY